jgi:hypothetical protein
VNDNKKFFKMIFFQIGEEDRPQRRSPGLLRRHKRGSSTESYAPSGGWGTSGMNGTSTYIIELLLKYFPMPLVKIMHPHKPCSMAAARTDRDDR